MARSKKRKPKKPRNLAVLALIVARKGGFMRDRRRRRSDPRTWRQEADDEASEA